MPNERAFLIGLADDAQNRIRFRSERGQIVEFLVQLETQLENEWRPVVRYDNRHRRPHVDTLDRWGREIDKRWLSMTNNEALTAGIDDLKRNWTRYLARFMEGGSR